MSDQQTIDAQASAMQSEPIPIPTTVPTAVPTVIPNGKPGVTKIPLTPSIVLPKASSSNRKPQNSRHFVSSPTSDHRGRADKITTPSKRPESRSPSPSRYSESDSEDDLDMARLLLEQQQQQEGGWPLFPVYIRDMTQENVLKMLLHMLGCGTDEISIASVRHNVMAFWKNELELHELYKTSVKFESSRVQKRMKIRDRLRNSLVSHLQLKSNPLLSPEKKQDDRSDDE